MTVIKHENFPDGVANLIRHFEFQLTGETHLTFPDHEYGPDVKPGEWLACVGKPAKAHRPFILYLDDGIKGNLLSQKQMREIGCSFIVFLRIWKNEPMPSFFWRSIKIWPEVMEQAKTSHASGHQCRIEVPIKGRVRAINL